MEIDAKLIAGEVKEALTSLFSSGRVNEGEILVVGCSTSEVCGRTIGSFSNINAAEIITESILKVTSEQGLFLAAQCCEHLNRALVLERKAVERYRLEEVFVVPVPGAGGAFAASARKMFHDPVLVENIQAHWGMDIGNTLIGMHMKPVAVPVRLPVPQIGMAHVTAARYRPKLIGGARAVYE